MSHSFLAIYATFRASEVEKTKDIDPSSHLHQISLVHLHRLWVPFAPTYICTLAKELPQPFLVFTVAEETTVAVR